MERRAVSGEELQNFIADLITSQALELLRCPEMNAADLYIPYMLNDALEYYLVLKQCTAIGSITGDFPEGTAVEWVRNQSSEGIILQRPGGEVTTLWYASCESVFQLYQYHRIGHFWRSGQEQWRQLVYVIGTIYDKREYLGSSICNSLELELADLITFGPFRYWSPIKESMDDYYPEEPAGLARMKALAEEAGDRAYLRLLRRYERMRKLPFVSAEKQRLILAQALTLPQRQPLYELLFHKVEEASQPYPQRDYGEALNRRIIDRRQHLTDEFHAMGFIGNYPRFRREKEQLLAMEEHPFTVSGMDYEGFSFRIQLMQSVSENTGLNAGFFEGRGAVYKSLEEYRQEKHR